MKVFPKYQYIRIEMKAFPVFPTNRQYKTPCSHALLINPRLRCSSLCSYCLCCRKRCSLGLLWRRLLILVAISVGAVFSCSSSSGLALKSLSCNVCCLSNFPSLLLFSYTTLLIVQLNSIINSNLWHTICLCNLGNI